MTVAPRPSLASHHPGALIQCLEPPGLAHLMPVWEVIIMGCRHFCREPCCPRCLLSLTAEVFLPGAKPEGLPALPQPAATPIPTGQAAGGRMKGVTKL